MRAAMGCVRVAAGLNPNKRPATREEILRQYAIKEESTPGTEGYATREQRLAIIEDRRPRHVLKP
jgi:hypothetical protein